MSVLKFSFAVKVWESRFSRDDSAQQWADKPLVFVWASELIEPLEALQKALADIDPKLAQRRVVLVEGQTEANFVSTIQNNSNLLNFDFSLYVYEGKAQVANLVHYIRERNRQGVRVDLCYDSDGQTDSFLEKLALSGCSVESRFRFQRDFEAAFPPELLHTAAHEYLRRYTNVPADSLSSLTVTDLLAQSKPFVRAFEEHFKISVSKPQLGVLLAEAVRRSGAVWDGAVKTAEECSEIAKFLRFVMLW